MEKKSFSNLAVYIFTVMCETSGIFLCLEDAKNKKHSTVKKERFLLLIKQYKREDAVFSIIKK
jgi:hypothetical protein